MIYILFMHLFLSLKYLHFDWKFTLVSGLLLLQSKVIIHKTVIQRKVRIIFAWSKLNLNFWYGIKVSLSRFHSPVVNNEKSIFTADQLYTFSFNLVFPYKLWRLFFIYFQVPSPYCLLLSTFIVSSHFGRTSML